MPTWNQTHWWSRPFDVFAGDREACNASSIPARIASGIWMLVVGMVRVAVAAVVVAVGGLLQIAAAVAAVVVIPLLLLVPVIVLAGLLQAASRLL